MNYRIYLVDADDHIKASESFSAKDDLEAEEVALAIHESCSTSFLRWSPKTGQVAKRESPFGTAGGRR